jgi:hypothetical protein
MALAITASQPQLTSTHPCKAVAARCGGRRGELSIMSPWTACNARRSRLRLRKRRPFRAAAFNQATPQRLTLQTGGQP